MSKIALIGNASGTGTLTIASPNTNSDRTLTLPDSTGTIATAESTLTQFSASGSAPVYACRAWVNLTGATIRSSGNVSSVTNTDAGTYTVNFATAMPDANYCFTATAGQGTGLGARIVTQETAVSASSITVRSRNVSDVNGNVSTICLAVFR